MALEAAARQALRLRGGPRLEADLRALEVVDRGELFAGSKSEWVQARRTDLARLATDVRLDAAEVAFELGALEQSERLLKLVRREDPYRESAWRLSMRIASAMGQDDRVIALYRSCRDHLAELPTEPSASTQRLLTQLRR